MYHTLKSLLVMSKVFFVYVDLTQEQSPRPFYVGKGSLERTKTKHRNRYWKNIAAKYGWQREIVLATKDEAFVFEEEIRRIAELGTFENGTPGRWGANLSEGGEGPSGYIQSPEQLELNRQKHIGSNNPMFGTKQSEEARARNRALSSGSGNLMYGKRGSDHPAYGYKHEKSFIERVSGENHHNSKLTWQLVREIREKYRTLRISHRKLAIEYGLTHAHVGKIIRNQAWVETLPVGDV